MRRGGLRGGDTLAVADEGDAGGDDFGAVRQPIDGVDGIENEVLDGAKCEVDAAAWRCSAVAEELRRACVHVAVGMKAGPFVVRKDDET
jgi:hypothetical protein